MICSSVSEYDNHGLTMLSHFASRGYPRKLLLTTFDKVRIMDRTSLIHPQQNPNKQQVIPLILTYQSNRHRSLQNIITDNQRILDNSMNNESFLENKVIIAYRRNPNLRSLLTKSAFPRSKLPRGTFQCHKNCSTCPLIVGDKEIWGSYNKTRYPTVGHSTCLTTCVIYVIRCNTCFKMYVGQTTNTLHQRRLQHTNDILRQRVEKPVAAHFNDVNHDASNLTIMVLDNSARLLNDRLRLEEAWIRRLATYSPKGLKLRT